MGVEISSKVKENRGPGHAGGIGSLKVMHVVLGIGVGACVLSEVSSNNCIGSGP